MAAQGPVAMSVRGAQHARGPRPLPQRARGDRAAGPAAPGADRERYILMISNGFKNCRKHELARLKFGLANAHLCIGGRHRCTNGGHQEAASPRLPLNEPLALKLLPDSRAVGHT